VHGMPKQETGLVILRVICISDVMTVKYHAPVLVRNEAICRYISCQIVAALVTIGKVKELS
jgi:hypothetical protein